MAIDTNTTRQSGNGDANVLINLAVAAATAGIAAAQAVAAAGNLTLVGGGYTGTGARRVTAVSSDAGDTTQTATFTGTDRYSNALVETVTLNGITGVATNGDFLTVTQVAISAVTAGNISAGTSAVGSSPWIPIERYRNNPISIAVVGIVTGTVTWTLEHTYDDPNTIAVPGTTNVPGVPFPYELVNGLNVGDAVPATAFADATLATKSATTEGTVTAPFAALRFTVNSGTGVLKGQIRVAAMASGLM